MNSTQLHYREAARMLQLAHDTYDDDSSDTAPSEDYPSEAEFFQAVADSNEAHDDNVREATMFATFAVAHALLAATVALEALTRQADPQPEAVAEAVGVLRTIPLHHHASNAFSSDR